MLATILRPICNKHLYKVSNSVYYVECVTNFIKQLTNNVEVLKLSTTHMWRHLQKQWEDPLLKFPSVGMFYGHILSSSLLKSLLIKSLFHVSNPTPWPLYEILTNSFNSSFPSCLWASEWEAACVEEKVLGIQDGEEEWTWAAALIFCSDWNQTLQFGGLMVESFLFCLVFKYFLVYWLVLFTYKPISTPPIAKLSFSHG